MRTRPWKSELRPGPRAKRPSPSSTPLRATLVFMTGRQDPRLDWIIDAIEAQAIAGDALQLIVVDALHAWTPRRLEDIGYRTTAAISSALHVAPKPNVWQGPHRLTQCDWWATSNARNTALALAEGPFVIFMDDRAHPGPQWLATARRYAASGEAVLAGSYDKIEGTPEARKISRDHRRDHRPSGKLDCGGSWLYGCAFALPLEWALEVNGFEEGCDGLTGEDYIFGLMLANSGHRIDFVPDFFVLQDRAPGNESCKGSYACRDKGVSPNDKSHAALYRFGSRRRTTFTPDLRALRARLAAGEPWPIPDKAAEHRDWYDDALIREMA